MTSILAFVLICIAFAAAALFQKLNDSTRGIRLNDLAKPKAKPDAGYRKKKALMSPAEASFYKVLKAAVPEAPIFPKVRLADVIDTQNVYHGNLSRIAQKHFDWVLCHPASFEPLVAIELDDSTHRTNRRTIKSDSIKDQCAKDAGITLLRFRCQATYDEDNVRDQIAAVVNQIGTTPVAPRQQHASAPQSPKNYKPNERETADRIRDALAGRNRA